MTSPLVTRPPYKGGESKLPGAGPTGKGLPVDSGLPGYKTFAQPPEEAPRTPVIKDEHPSKVEDADSLLKDRGRIDTREQWVGDVPSAYGQGPSDSGSSKTRYPYRDNKPNEKNAMYRTASTTEVKSDLRNLLAYLDTPQPSREMVLNRLASIRSKLAMEFPSEPALKEYLKNHPNADPKNHSVAKKEDGGSSGGGSAHPKVKEILDDYFEGVDPKSAKDFASLAIEGAKKLRAEGQDMGDQRRNRQDSSSYDKVKKDLISKLKSHPAAKAADLDAASIDDLVMDLHSKPL